METLELADLEALFAGATVDVSEQWHAVRQHVAPLHTLSPEEEAKAHLESLLSNALTRNNLPRWIVNGKHEALALRLMQDHMFVQGYMQRKSFTLRKVREHYKSHDKMKQ